MRQLKQVDNEMFDLLKFERGQIVGARLVGVSVTKIGELFYVS